MHIHLHFVFKLNANRIVFLLVLLWHCNTHKSYRIVQRQKRKCMHITCMYMSRHLIRFKSDDPGVIRICIHHFIERTGTSKWVTSRCLCHYILTRFRNSFRWRMEFNCVTVKWCILGKNSWCWELLSFHTFCFLQLSVLFQLLIAIGIAFRFWNCHSMKLLAHRET